MWVEWDFVKNAKNGSVLYVRIIMTNISKLMEKMENGGKSALQIIKVEKSRKVAT